MVMKFERGPYGSLTFTRTGCKVVAFRPDESVLFTGWCLLIGTNVYDGFASRRAAVEGVGRFI